MKKDSLKLSDRLEALYKALYFYSLAYGYHCDVSVSKKTDCFRLNVFVGSSIFNIPEFASHVCGWYEKEFVFLKDCNTYCLTLMF